MRRRACFSSRIVHMNAIKLSFSPWYTTTTTAATTRFKRTMKFINYCDMNEYTKIVEFFMNLCTMFFCYVENLLLMHFWFHVSIRKKWNNNQHWLLPVPVLFFHWIHKLILHGETKRPTIRFYHSLVEYIGLSILTVVRIDHYWEPFARLYCELQCVWKIASQQIVPFEHNAMCRLSDRVWWSVLPILAVDICVCFFVANAILAVACGYFVWRCPSVVIHKFEACIHNVSSANHRSTHARGR